MRVAVDGYPVSGARTGVGRYVGELLCALARMPGTDVVAVMSRRHPWGPPDVRDLEHAGVAVRYPNRVASKIFWLGRRFEVPVPFSAVAGRHDRSVFTSYERFAGRRPSMSFVYDLSYVFWPQFTDPSHLRFLRTRVPALIDRSNLIGTISNTVATELTSVFPGACGRVVVAEPGGTTALTPTAPPDWRRRCGDLGLRPGYVLHVGTIEPRKNLAALVRAIDKLPPAVCTQLVLVGRDGWRNEAIKEAIAASGDRVRWLPQLSDTDLRAVYEGATLLAFPSHYEGFGLPLLEAMALGVPIACSNIAVFREVAADAAVFFDHRDTTSIAEGLYELLTDPTLRDRLRTRGYARVRRHSWHRTAATVHAALTELSPPASLQPR